MPELPYDDGAGTIFLYTKGTEGNPPEELRQLMRYMEHSTLSNAQTAGLVRLHKTARACCFIKRFIKPIFLS